MARARFKWNIDAFEEVRRSGPVEDQLQGIVNGVLGRLESDYAGGVESGRTRSRGYVVTTSAEAIRAEAENHALLRAIGGAG